MKEIFKKYYLSTFIWIGCLFVFQALIGERNIPLWEATLLSLAMSIALTLFIGTIYLVVDKIFSPKHKQKMLEKSPFKDFYAIGFEQRDGIAIGTVNGFQILLKFHAYSSSNETDIIEIDILFNPKKNHSFLKSSEIEELRKKYKKEKFVWNRDSISKQWKFSMFPPKFDEVHSAIERGIQLLKTEKLLPITFKESEKILPEFEQYLERENSLKAL